MKLRHAFQTLAFFFALTTPSAFAKKQNKNLRNLEEDNGEDSHRYVVQYKRDSDLYKEKLKENKRKLSEEGETTSVNRDSNLLVRDAAEVVYLPTLEDVRKLLRLDGVLRVEPDFKIYMTQSATNEVTPYGINSVNALAVSDANVSNRKVCIVDSGYDINHDDLPKSSTGSSVTGSSYTTGDPWFQDDSLGHGTHVAGTICALGGNGKGVVGVNRNGKLNLHIVRVFGGSSGGWIWSSGLVSAVEECVENGANIVNMSLGSSGSSNFMNEAFQNIYDQGVLLVAAAGNGGSSSHFYPASYSSVMSVAALRQDETRASFSQYNDQVDISAPGVSVSSTMPGNSYGLMSGTSMASPHVAGVAALIWSHYPTKTAQEVRAALTASAKDLGVPGRDNYYGHGLVQADKALQFLGAGLTAYPTTSPTPAPTVFDDCNDSPAGWIDSYGDGCEWYEQYEQPGCPYWGHVTDPNGIYSANQVCCHCGGGSGGGPPPPTSPTPPTPSPTRPPTPAPTPSPTPAPTNGDGQCVNKPGWIDSYGDSCDWYENYEEPGCPIWGHVTDPTNGVPATEACCHCKDDSDQCSDVPNWKDAWGDGCDWYTSPYLCDIYSSYPGDGGLTVTQACCACGGGV